MSFFMVIVGNSISFMALYIPNTCTPLYIFFVCFSIVFSYFVYHDCGLQTVEEGHFGDGKI